MLKSLELISHKKRIQIVNLLYNEPNLYTSQIAQKLNLLDRKLVKYHLDKLEDEGMVEKDINRNYILTLECKDLFERLYNVLMNNGKSI